MAGSTIEDGYFANLTKFSAGLVLLIALLTQGPLDPTPFNPVWPNGGPENFFGIAGAFCAGFLKESLGVCAYAIPFLLLVASQKKNVSRVRKLGRFFLALSVIVTMFALMFPRDYPELPALAGVWGAAAQSILLRFPGRILSLVVLIPALTLSLVVLKPNEFVFSYAYSLASMFRDGSKSSYRSLVRWGRRLGEKTGRRFGGVLAKTESGISKSRDAFAQFKEFLIQKLPGVKNKKLFDISLPFKIPSRAKIETAPRFSSDSPAPAGPEPVDSIFHKALEEYEKELLKDEGEASSSGERLEDLFEDLIDDEGEGSKRG